MMDADSRRRLMARFRGKDTKPEVAARRALHRLGYRFRLHRKDLPGRPDIVLPRHRAIVFVHGCFWHRHPGCRVATTPKTRPDFWRQKFEQNVQRDIRNIAQLEAAGWRVLILWECETRDTERLFGKLAEFLGPSSSAPGDARLQSSRIASRQMATSERPE